MKTKHYSIAPFWDKTAIDAKTKLSRIMLTINMRGKQFRITLKLRATKVDFDKATSAARTLSEEAKGLRKDLNDYLMKAETIMERLDNPTKEMFSRLFKSETDLFHNNKTSIAPFFKHKIAKFFKEEKFSSSVSYELALKSLSKYKGELNFEDIDGKFLKGYVAFMIDMGNSVSTAGIYLRNLRAIFNEVIREGVIAKRFYPFERFSFATNVKSKEVLYPEQLKSLLNYEPTCEAETKAIAYFFFCYLSNGMNFQDAALLKYKNISGDILTFVRHKTKKTAREIKVYLHDLTKQIIIQYGTGREGDDYIFGLVTDKMDAFYKQQQLNRHKRISNKLLSKIGVKLGFDVHLCLNLARHSFATKQKLDGYAVAAISDCMGHSNLSTTEHYMKSLPNENLKVMSSNLLSF